jgi:glycosyltransferase involved in cell wall biosynthesis
MEKQKILYVITQGGPWGGAQKYVLDLAIEAQKYFEVAIAVGEKNGPDDLQKNATRAGIKIIQLEHLGRSIKPIEDLKSAYELKGLFLSFSPDIIHLNSSKAGILGSIAHQLTKSSTTRLVYTAHGWVFKEPIGFIRKTLYSILESKTAKAKDKIIVLSQEDASTAKKIGIPESKIYTQPLHIQKPKNTYSKNQAKTRLCEIMNCSISATMAPWIGTIANCFPTKGLDILLKSLANEVSLNRAHVFIIGDGPERKELEKLAKKLNVSDRVHFAGFQNDAQSYLPAFDIFVLPSRKEGLPYAIIEAIAAKIPVVSTMVGGIPELIKNNESGWLVKPNNPKLLGQALGEALTAKDAKERAEKAYTDALAKKIISIAPEEEPTLELYRSLSAEPKIKL